MNKEEYREYLNHPLWIKRRDAILGSRKRQCERCSEHMHLEVHHKTYSRGKMPWEYPDENFEILCEKCHAHESSVEYVANFCSRCKRPIRKGFVTCIDCRDKRLDELEDTAKGLLREQQKVLASIEDERQQRKKVSNTKVKTQPPSDNERSAQAADAEGSATTDESPPRRSRLREPIPAPEKKSNGTLWLVFVALAVVSVVVLLTPNPPRAVEGAAETSPPPVAEVPPPPKKVAQSAVAVAPPTETLSGDLRPGSRGSFRLLIKSVSTPSNGNVYLEVWGVGGGQSLSLVIFRNRRSAFGDLSALAGKEVVVTGTVTVYRNQKQIIIETPSQLRAL